MPLCRNIARRTRRPSLPLMTKTLLLRDAFDLFDRKNLDGGILDARTGTSGSVSPARRNVLRTYVKSAAARAVGLHPKDPAVLDVDLLPFLSVLPDLAHLDATALRRTDPANEASGVRTFLRTVTNDRLVARTYKRRVRPESLLPAWRPLADALRNASSQQSGRFSKYVGWLETLQNILVLNGVRRPEDIPDYATVAAWVAAHITSHASKDDLSAQDGVTLQERIDKRRSSYFSAYRTARKLLGCPADLPALPKPHRDCERGVKALPDLEQRIEDAAMRLQSQGVGLPSPLPGATSDPLAILDVLAPEIAKATRSYIEWTKTSAVRSDAWQAAVVGAASGFVAELIRLGEDAFTLDYPDMFLQSRETAKTTPTNNLGLKRRVALVDREELPLFRVVLDAATRRSFLNSPFTLPASQADLSVPLYTPAVFNDFAAAWAVTEQVYGQQLGMETQSPDEWRDIERTHTRIAEHMKEYNDSREMEGHKDKTLVSANWGQAVCIGGGILWRHARERRTAWKESVAKYGDNTAPARRARRAYGKALDDYILWIVLLDDGMRIANYAQARIGRHVRLTSEIVNGERRITGVTTHFRGYDAEARTKKRRKAGGRQNVRTRTLNPGIVDMELFTDFMYVSRVDDLVTAGCIANRDAYDPESDSFALFVSRQSTRPSGAYLTSRLSKRWGRMLHWLMRDVLQHSDPEGNQIPSWKELQRSKPLRRKWRAIWNAHVLRQLIATFVVGVLKDEATACRMTNDTPATLAAFYNQFDDNLAELMKGPKGINHPEHFADICGRLLRGEILDWATFDAHNPASAQWVTQQQALRAPKPARSRRSRFVAA